MEIKVGDCAPRITLELSMAEFALIYDAIVDSDSNNAIGGVRNYDVFVELRNMVVNQGLKLPKVKNHESNE